MTTARTTAPPTALGLGPEETHELLVAAGRAPSLHNSQPWRFRLGPDAVDVLADPARRLPATDPEGRELRISCGAALFHVRLAVRCFGARPVVTLLPDRAEPDLLARVGRGETVPPTPQVLELWRAVATRTTNRHPFSDTPVSPADEHALRRAASQEGAWLHVVDDPRRRESVARLVAVAHQEQLADPAVRDELAAWTATSDDRPDGVTPAAGGPRPHPHERWVHRDFTGAAPPPRRWARFEAEPLVCVLAGRAAGPRAELAAGQALERVLLEATVRGLSVSMMSEVVEVPRTRAALGALLTGAREPQAVLRIGHGWPSPRTRRLRAGATVAR